MIKIYTIGFTKKTARYFFETLIKNSVNKIIDVRCNNKSQLAGFAKSPDLEFFAKKICNIDYEHILDFAPSKELLSDYRNKKTKWSDYKKIFRKLIDDRDILNKYPIKNLDNACLLCSEDLPDKCHRKLLAEYFKEFYTEVNIIHL